MKVCIYKCTYPQWRMLKRIADGQLNVDRYRGQTIKSLHAKGCIMRVAGNYWSLTHCGQKMLAGKGRVREGLDAS